MGGDFCSEAERTCDDASVESVSCVFHVGSDAELFLVGGFVEPILSADVIGFLFARREGRALEREEGFGIEVSGDGGSAEVSSEEVLFLSVKIDEEGFRVVDGSELRFSVFRDEAVGVVGDVSEYVKRPAFVGSPGKEGLIVQELGFIFRLRVGGSHEVTCCFVAQ